MSKKSQQPPPLMSTPPDCIIFMKIHADPFINTPPVYEIFLKCRPPLLLDPPLQLPMEEYTVCNLIYTEESDVPNELSRHSLSRPYE